MSGQQEARHGLDDLRLYVESTFAHNDVRYTERFNAEKVVVHERMDGVRGRIEYEATTRVEQIRASMAEADRRYMVMFADAREAATLAALASAAAIAKSDVATEKRFDGVNEFRATLTDNQRNLFPRLEADARFSGIEQKINALEQAINAKLVQLDAAIQKTLDSHAQDIRALRDALNADTGRRGGSATVIAYIISVAMFLLAAGALYLRASGK